MDSRSAATRDGHSSSWWMRCATELYQLPQPESHARYVRFEPLREMHKDNLVYFPNETKIRPFGLDEALKGLKLKATKSAPANAEQEWQAVQTCQFAIMSTAKFHDPGSIEWPGLSRSFRELKNGIYTVQVEVRGRNAFNAKVLNVFECKMRARGLAVLSVKKVA